MKRYSAVAAVCATTLFTATVASADAGRPRVRTAGAAVVQPPPPPTPEVDTAIVGGAEVLYLKPHFGSNPAFLTHIDNGFIDDHFQTDFSYDYNAAPRAWIGFQRPGKVGVRGRYFDFDDRSNSPSAADAQGPGAGTANFVVQTAAPGGLGFLSTGTAAAPTTLNFTSGLDLQTFDLEATWMMDSGPWHCLLSGGLRYAEINQFYTANQITAAGVVNSIIDSRSSFDGVGPTVGAESRVPVGDQGFSLYGNGRASVIFGDSNQTVNAQVIPTGTRPNFTNNFTTQDTMPIAELELGVEWRQELVGQSWYVQGGVVAQTYFGVGNASNTEDLAPRAGVGAGTVNRQGEVDQASSDANLSLVGFKLAGGFNF
jgi:hypothetical protein